MTPIDWLLSGDTGVSSETICAVMTGSVARHNDVDKKETSDIPRPVEPVVRFLFRPHRELLADAMREVQKFGSKNELIKHLQTEIDKFCPGKYDCSRITIEKYGSGIDGRIGWDTHIVHLDGYGVFGFTNGPAET